MKLTDEDKVLIYKLRKQGYSYVQLSNRYGVQLSNLIYMIKLIDRYGIEIVKKGKNHYYSPELKQEIIDKVLFTKKCVVRLCFTQSFYGVKLDSTIQEKWVSQFPYPK